MISRLAGEEFSPTISFVEFVLIIALLMSLTALSVDIMLPALPAIDDYFGIVDANDRQLIITTYMLGFAVGMPFFGPLSDRFGRKPVLAFGLAVYVIATIGTMLVEDYSTLLLLRFVQGIGCASPRIVSIAVVRDRFGGREMAQVMSFVMMIFVILPVMAPAIGSGILLFGNWQTIFLALLIVGIGIAGWTQFRLPETRSPHMRQPLSIRWIGKSLKTTVTTRETLGYTIATTFIFGPIIGYINSAQQIFGEVFDQNALFPLFFALVAIALAAAGFLNGRLVGALGMRRLSHGAVIGFIATSALHLVLGMGDESHSVWVFCGFLSAQMFFFGIVMPNFNAMAMEPLGEIAGTAASFIGAVTTAGGAIIGWYIGGLYDGSYVPLLAGYLICGLVGLVIVAITERGRLFAPHHEPLPAAEG